MRIPKLSHHKALGKGYLTFQGHRYYVPGKWPEGQPLPATVRSAYFALAHRLLSGEDPNQAKAKTQQEAQEANRGELTVAEVVDRCLTWADGYYHGTSKEAANLTYSTPELLELFGELPARQFGPKALRAVQERMVAKGFTRQGINRRINRIRRIFKWAAGEELVPCTVADGLRACLSLRRKHTQAPEFQRTGLVPDELVDKALPFMAPQIRAMVELCRLSGMRPSEVCRMRTEDIDRQDSTCWWYRPKEHKTALIGKTREIAIGPRAIAILQPWLNDAEPERFLFRPVDVMAAIWKAKREARKTPVTPSQKARAKQTPKKAPGERYNTIAFTRAVYRACDAAGVSQWSPGRLRKSCAQKILRIAGLEPARAALGHADSEITKAHYLQQERQLAKEAILQVG